MKELFYLFVEIKLDLFWKRDYIVYVKGNNAYHIRQGNAIMKKTAEQNAAMKVARTERTIRDDLIVKSTDIFDMLAPYCIENDVDWNEWTSENGVYRMTAEVVDMDTGRSVQAIGSGFSEREANLAALCGLLRAFQDDESNRKDRAEYLESVA